MTEILVLAGLGLLMGFAGLSYERARYHKRMTRYYTEAGRYFAWCANFRRTPQAAALIVIFSDAMEDSRPPGLSNYDPYERSLS